MIDALRSAGGALNGLCFSHDDVTGLSLRVDPPKAGLKTRVGSSGLNSPSVGQAKLFILTVALKVEIVTATKYFHLFQFLIYFDIFYFYFSIAPDSPVEQSYLNTFPNHKKSSGLNYFHFDTGKLNMCCLDNEQPHSIGC